MIGNEAFEVEADPARGGGLTRVLDRRTGTELLRGLGNELVLTEEYAGAPALGRGAVAAVPEGPGHRVRRPCRPRSAQRCPLGSRLVAEFSLGDLRVTQETILWDGLDQVEFRTHVDGSIGQDRLLRVRFPAQVPGGLPVFQCATAVVGRPFGVADSDVAEDAYTLDNPACEWFGLSSTVRVSAGATPGRSGWPRSSSRTIPPRATLARPGRECSDRPGHQSHISRAPAAGSEPGTQGAGRAEGRQGAGPAEGWRAGVRALVAALAAAGVTATCSRADGPRYGALDLDSNLPDCPDRGRRPRRQPVDGPAARRARPRRGRRDRPAGRPGRRPGLGARGAPPGGGVHRRARTSGGTATCRC